MPPKTPARSGLMRSGAGRSGYPIPVGARALMYAQSGVMRSGVSRSNYHDGRVYITIGGVHVGTGREGASKILATSLSLTDALNETPTTGRATAIGFAPQAGQEVVIQLGSKHTLHREFGGTILRTTHGALTSDPSKDQIGLALIDYTWGLNARKVSEYYTGSASTIAAALLATYAPGYTAAIAPGLPTVTGGITFTNQELTACLSQLCKRIGANWMCDYHRVVSIPAARADDTPPTVLNAIHPSLRDFSHDRDLSQAVTRVYVEGGGVTAAATVAAGETILPLDGDPGWYDPAGGTVVSGPQRITYTGVSASAGGGLVGTGAAPSGAPHLALASGSGVTLGTHAYATTFVTAVGESIAGPAALMTAGLLEPPAAAPQAGTATPGSGPDAGTHEYALTYVTAAGETTPGPRVAATTGLTPGPTTAPVPAPPTYGAGPEVGVHEYAVAFYTAIGETVTGPIGGAVYTAPLPGPTTAPQPGIPTAGVGPDPGPHEYAASFVTALGDTSPGPLGPTVLTSVVPPPPTGPAAVASEGAGPDAGSHDYGCTFVTALGESALGPLGPAVVCGEVAPPTTAPVVVQDQCYLPTILSNNGMWSPGATLLYALTFKTAAGETTVGPVSASTVARDCIDYYGRHYGPRMQLTQLPVTPAGVTKRIYRSVNGVISPVCDWTSTAGQGYNVMEVPAHVTSITDEGLYTEKRGIPATNTAAIHVLTVTDMPIGPAGTTGRRLYRRFNAAGTAKLVTTIANNTWTSVTDTTPNASLGADAPASGTSQVCVVALTNIPTGGAGVTARRVYRRSAGAGLRLLTTIANNSTTTYTDTAPNASLGAAAMPGTAPAGVVALSDIPTGPAGSGVLGRHLYRRSGGAGLRLLTTIANTSATTFTDTTPNASLSRAPLATSQAFINRIPLTALPVSSSPLVTARRLYGTAAGGTVLGLIAELNTTVTTYLVTTVDAALGVAAPVSNTAVTGRVTLTGIPIGAPAVTARKLYRSAADTAAPLRLLTTIADNTTTTWLDAAADAVLGATAPAVDTSGLTQPQGNVLAGSTSLVVASIGAFPASGWAVIGNGQQVIRYTSVSGNVLGGIPASGAGAILATIAFNSTVTSAPVLTGIPASGAGRIRYPILKGSDVNIWIQVDDLGAQLARAALLGGDGVQEDYLQDRRLAKPEATARALTILALKREPVVTVHYTSRDLNTRAGRTVVVNLGAPYAMFAVPLLIQSVTQSFALSRTRILPLYAVEASSVRLTFDELLAMTR